MQLTRLGVSRFVIFNIYIFFKRVEVFGWEFFKGFIYFFILFYFFNNSLKLRCVKVYSYFFNFLISIFLEKVCEWQCLGKNWIFSLLSLLLFRVVKFGRERENKGIILRIYFYLRNSVRINSCVLWILKKNPKFKSCLINSA